MEYKLRKKPDEVLEMAVKAVRYARNKVAEVEFSPEDGTRSEIPFLCRVIEKVIDAGARIINVPGHGGLHDARPSSPRSSGRSWRARRTWTRRSCPCTATTTWAWRWPTPWRRCAAGARQVEVTVNGIGERAGNASLEEFVMALCVQVRHPSLHHRHQHAPDLEHLAPAVQHDRVPHPAQQAHHRGERLRPRIGHPPGRRAEEA